MFNSYLVWLYHLQKSKQESKGNKHAFYGCCFIAMLLVSVYDLIIEKSSLFLFYNLHQFADMADDMVGVFFSFFNDFRVNL